MATETRGTRAASAPAADASGARLLPPVPKRSLAEHVAWFGDLPGGGPGLVAEAEQAKLRGKGGARFPTATKLAAVAAGRRPVVVANGTEGEPASSKDTVLMGHAPHLVLDGAVLAAETVGAQEAVVCVKRGAVVRPVLERALAERRAQRYDRVTIRIEATSDRYVAGEETALVSWLNGRDAKPTFVPPRPFERGVGGRPTLVQNVETLADLALLGRFGAAWYRAAGTRDDPGTTLVTLSGGVERPGVYEVALGSRLGDVLGAAGGEPAKLSGVLVGGYFGGWLAPAVAADARVGVESMRRAGTGLGAGVIVAMPAGACALAEVARVTRWLAGQNAGQCGPCVNGLDAIAGALAAVVAGDRDRRAEQHLTRWLAMVDGRGACKHPDGVVRFVGSALTVFADEVARHRRQGACPQRGGQLLPTPATGGWR